MNPWISHITWIPGPWISKLPFSEHNPFPQLIWRSAVPRHKDSPSDACPVCQGCVPSWGNPDMCQPFTPPEVPRALGHYHLWTAWRPQSPQLLPLFSEVQDSTNSYLDNWSITWICSVTFALCCNFYRVLVSHCPISWDIFESWFFSYRILAIPINFASISALY